MSSQARGSNDLDRQRFIADPEVLAALDVSVEDLADPAVREAVIRREHPEFEPAFREGLEEADLGHGPINPRLHLTMHQVVAEQLCDNTPPEVWQTATRLLDQGYDRHEVLHMLMRTTSNQVWAALHDDRPYDRAQHVAELRALPDSWERERSALTMERRHDDARKEARRRTRAARRRNRRPK